MGGAVQLRGGMGVKKHGRARELKGGGGGVFLTRGLGVKLRCSPGKDHEPPQR